jgi:FAD:protein FMN transferase
MTASRAWSAWSCTVRLVVADARVLDAAARDLVDLLDRVDRAASRFRPDSALCRANTQAGKAIPIPRELVELVACALDAAAQTAGAVDPTIGLSLSSNGYDRDIAELPRNGPAVCPVVPPADWRSVRLDRAAGLLVVPRGVALDLGATAKARTADAAAESLSRRYETAVLVELGGDVAVSGQIEGGWPLFVAEHDGGDGELVVLSSGGLATSTTTIRRWQRGGRTLHHILDPRTGEPADGCWRTATVAARSAVAANTASTAALVMGEAAEQWLTARNLAARLVHQDATIRTTPGWPALELASLS